MSKIQSNRYLQLDGTPAESGEWRRFISPWTLTAAFTGALIACAITEGKTEKYTPSVIFVIAAAGVATRSMIRGHLMKNLKEADLQDFVIDTTPESKKHACTKQQLNQILFETKINAALGIGVNITFAAVSFARIPLFDALAFELPYLPAPLAHSYEGYYLANKLTKNDWVVIGRGEMKMQEEPATMSIASPT